MAHNLPLAEDGEILGDPEILRALARLIRGVENPPTQKAEPFDAEVDVESASDAQAPSDWTRQPSDWDFLVRSRLPRA